ncbi:MAG: hypoxanthine phosphoribosyltransferase [Leptospiraceae bacterium]|nr:hypoxanthine phosphoribosyltransferase [Leptospiraceae bacterium]MCP5493903.1 hypoxanthine phosphoribosyltransferase [Leptospiraceae bacterium]
MKDNILIPKNDIQNRVRFLGEQIAKEYENKEPIFVGILKGSFIFLADLVRGVSIPLMIDFIEASSYEEKESSGNIRILKDLNINIENRHVIVVEDIIDTGNTLNHIIDNLFSRKPSSLKICSLFVKSKKHTLNYSIEYYGFEIEDHFVVGYGMDYKGMYRNLEYIMIV